MADEVIDVEEARMEPILPSEELLAPETMSVQKMADEVVEEVTMEPTPPLEELLAPDQKMADEVVEEVTIEPTLPLEELLAPKTNPFSKYQWRSGVEESSSSDSEEDEEFHKILNSKVVSEDVIEKPLKNQKKCLDTDYYLPELEALTINSLESILIEPFGKVQQLCDALVSIKAHPGVPYLDIDTMLFDSQKKPIGKIYELMGLVSDPLYNLLFASAEAASSECPVGTELFYAPSAENEVTKHLHIQDLQSGSKGNNQEEVSDDSEDEEAQYYKNLRLELEKYENRKRASMSTTKSNPSRGTKRGPPRNYQSNEVPMSYGMPQFYPAPYSTQMHNSFALRPQLPYYPPPGLFNYNLPPPPPPQP